jgi:hypothetical protein
VRVIKRSKIRRPSIQARPSRIRREPLHVQQEQQLSRNAWWTSQEWEIRLAMAGVIFFALAISAAVIDLGHLLSN